VEKERVVSSPTLHAITTFAAIDLVIASTAIDCVISDAAVHRIISCAAADRVIAGTSSDHIIATTGLDVLAGGVTDKQIGTVGKNNTHGNESLLSPGRCFYGTARRRSERVITGKQHGNFAERTHNSIEHTIASSV
jgi:hypothetical protein